MKEQTNGDGRDGGYKISRRDILLAGGATLVGATLIGSGSRAFASPVEAPVSQEGFRPIVLPKSGSKDPVDFSIAENAFWNEQMMEN